MQNSLTAGQFGRSIWTFRMDYEAPPPHSLRKIIHDLNGEIFLLRGYADLSLGQLPENSPVRGNLAKMLERTDEIQAIVARLRDRQRELEPE